MDRFEATVVTTMIANIESQLQSLKTIIAAGMAKDRDTEPRAHRIPHVNPEDSFTSEEEDDLIEKAILKQTQIESDTIGDIYQQRHDEMNADGNEGRRESGIVREERADIAHDGSGQSVE